MIEKSKLLCSIPFSYSEVFKDRHYLCCPGWLTEDIYDTGNILQDFHSKKANDIRESILDGSYKYCDSKQCPHLAALKQGTILDKRLVPKNEESIEMLRSNVKLTNVNLCFDESCNYKCPSCRLDFINFKGKELTDVEEKLLQVENELGSVLQKMTLTGGGDPLFSNSFRKFLLRFEPEKFPKLKNIHLLTNGSLWTEQLWTKLKKIHPYVNTCEISIDAGTKETYENKTRIGGKWDNLLNRLDFITSIPTIKHFTFSFVVQDTNYAEMSTFYELISNLKWNNKQRYTIFFNHITNWGTYTDTEYLHKDVANKGNIDHKKFLTELQKVHNKVNVMHNFKHLVKEEVKII